MSQQLTHLFTQASQNPSIRELTLDSRQVRPGDLFLAVPGGRADGRDHIEEALAHGAAAVAYESEGATVLPLTNVPLIPVKGLVAQLSAIAGSFYNEPGRHLDLIGVTGTNGKTTTTQLIAQGLDALGNRCGTLGTLGCGFVGAIQAGKLTTPDAVSVQAYLADLRKAGARAVAMEVSSHALDQHRVAALPFDVAVFTNLTRDHLDYHGTLQAYGEAKAKLFTRPELGHRVINLDDPFGRVLAGREHESKLITYSLEDERATLFCRDADFGDHGVKALLATPYGRHTLRSPLLGRFNLSNVLAAVGVLVALGHPMDEILHIVARFKGPEGRVQQLGGNGVPRVVVDYSHTPDALEKILQALRPHVQGQLVCVFGCGGDRDRGKRPEMAAIAERLADRVVVTDDNPRTEAPQVIFDDIRAGFANASAVAFISGRGEAIDQAIGQAAAGDLLVIAGKGHENYQEIDNVRHPFSDVQRAQQALAKWEADHA
ncbi:MULTISPECIES: UDP-N-acetylmuramoyl-L-alanyl-D-glutamate--2,6-diaminopimelate ligase [unclassified Pseudomonas]|uniref:UDP-N-acetylmuramoyl-L-alanyl-D-glutamate--2, 6-diaminopimelate ligase n=1 Tax=unclassified Pseudomonas TaxID=196821 RepID=UPI000BC72A7B|nr:MULTISPECIES: UDP-N-acetylmuramoyl-L-alanyl-D-glutamate--2,6-diaminopimelate ligase [unclassified Pseudomonas]PVZ16115.1 UDP-N-acetylmuramoylalanyl-D-glutamate--2,6-diaminopimelate ligase [Pseudomonas sp. URIL14HWK12:I12]PVZ26029.1 UDP-N-acetylmuramoylalanyl-D-glutamate--2,6-diaminopimelate ligase [Pseudomonas sp. URIL14HWK12:I10]PVZ36447.1 UDP-N-acetylmuramoylalanyl-D-glutamate--2,6-diaminopimelate ligase [Pseudomonas sp. URIL14HWK12:I11]SNZ18509.1 UDP-N-acetylmuramoylalanyl-D-glutamate--2,